MKRIIKTLRCENGNLFVTSAGKRLPFADFSGRIEIEEHTALVPILGTVQKGDKTNLRIIYRLRGCSLHP